MKPVLALVFAAFTFIPMSAHAAPVITAIGADLSQGSYSFGYLGNVFSFGATGDVFNPLFVLNQAPAATNSFGGFLDIPTTPTSSFTDRGLVTFGSSDSYTSFSTPTAVPYSLGNNFIGLRATVGGQDYYGFAYTTDALLNSIGFETTAGQTITATTAISAVPELATWGMMILGMGAVGGAMRRRPKVRTTVSFA
ncbi:PEPxxWA-CTERM sorting domain-containing protein [Sphingomonas sp. BAUL-RG-20F-R05-02]|uniref:PEPxxWA-CTERM sorting domain-containing protein n=1 Tax=Sphingomonas sp. BAUL-RG-20F-R05-02 TaxID=2914830 RepID=UPI001F569BBB|nr:PEPxxWA-CTERM sorting domain-containing protein [Sphingomonas sp. BAUL-RG-20F-R05-02]